VKYSTPPVFVDEFSLSTRDEPPSAQTATLVMLALVGVALIAEALACFFGAFDGSTAVGRVELIGPGLCVAQLLGFAVCEGIGAVLDR
jgi:hypothetical protein